MLTRLFSKLWYMIDDVVSRRPFKREKYINILKGRISHETKIWTFISKNQSMTFWCLDGYQAKGEWIKKTHTLNSVEQDQTWLAADHRRGRRKNLCDGMKSYRLMILTSPGLLPFPILRHLAQSAFYLTLAIKAKRRGQVTVAPSS